MMSKHSLTWFLAIAITLAVVGAAVGMMGVQKVEATPAEPGIFCKLSPPALRERLGEIRAEFLTQVKGVDELEQGFRYWFDKSPEQFKLLVDFIDYESQCCAFFQFDLSVAPGADRVALSLTGRTGTKAFLESMMESVAFDWRVTSAKP